MRPKAIFTLLNGGGSYKVDVYLVENATDAQNEWEKIQGDVIFDYQLDAVRKDMKKDGFITKVIK